GEHRELEESLREAMRMLELQVNHDGMTGLFNRQYLYGVLEREVARFRRYGAMFAVLMIDLDGFKKVNDSWGHGEGDRVLKTVATTLQEALRKGDLVARFGGDEFCAILPNTTLDAARQTAERICLCVRALTFGDDDSATVRASVGIGMAELLDASLPADAL